MGVGLCVRMFPVFILESDRGMVGFSLLLPVLTFQRTASPLHSQNKYSFAMWPNYNFVPNLWGLFLSRNQPSVPPSAEPFCTLKTCLPLLPCFIPQATG